MSQFSSHQTTKSVRTGTTIQIPKLPWSTLMINFYGPLPSGEYLLVLIDRYSRFPEVKIVKSTKASVIIPKLDRIFSVHEIPEIIKSDNRPPFQGEEFCKYFSALGIKHEQIAPRWPQANGQVERFNQPLAKTNQAAIVED